MFVVRFSEQLTLALDVFERKASGSFSYKSRLVLALYTGFDCWKKLTLIGPKKLDAHWLKDYQDVSHGGTLNKNADWRTV